MDWQIKRRADLARGAEAAAKPASIRPLAYPGDGNAHEWVVTVTDNGEPVDLTGATVTGYFYRHADGATPFATGTISGNVATVKIPSAAYALGGYVTGIMRAAVGDVLMTLDCIVFPVGPNVTREIIDPGTVIQDIDALVAAIHEAVESIPADYTALEDDVDGLHNALKHDDIKYRYSHPTIFDKWEQGSLNYNTGVETVNTTACRTVFYYEPTEDMIVSISNPDGNIIGTRKYNAQTGEYISAGTITNNSIIILESGYKYRLVCTNIGNPESITATFSYNSAFSAEDMIGGLDTYTSVSDYVRNHNLVVNALFSKRDESSLSIQRQGFGGIKLVGTLEYEAFTYLTIGSVSITNGETYTIYVKSKNGLDNSKIYVSLESIPGVAYNFGMGVPLVFTATATNATARVRAWVGDPSYANGYPIDDVWYVYVVPGVHSLAEFEGNRVVTEKLTVCAWNIGLYNYGRSRADYPATAQMDMMRESLVRKFLTDLYPDVICCTEFYNLDLNHDGDDSDSRKDFDSIYPYYYKTNQYMVASKYPVANISYTEYDSQDDEDALKKGWIAFDLLLSGATIKVISTHATAFSYNANIREEQFQQLLSSIPTHYDRVIVMGDFNTQSVSDLHHFTEAGYSALNGGYSGYYGTYPSIAPEQPYDNILIKGIYGVGCTYKEIYDASHAEDVDYYVSDHLPYIGQLIVL